MDYRIIKCLGIWCGPDIEGAINFNFKEKIKKMKTLLNMWSQRQLSLKGKIAVLRTVILPQILYVASTLYTPEWVEKEVDGLFFKFLWSSKKPHVRREVVISEISNGGLKMPLFSGMLRGMKCSWIKRLLSKDYQRKNLASHFVKYKGYNIVDIIQFKLDIDHVVVSSPFYQQVLKYWFELYSVHPIDKKESMTMPIWHNKYLKINQKPVFYKHWHTSGITCIYDIVSTDGRLRSREELEAKYNVQIKQMEYNSLTHAIPKQSSG